MTLPDEVKSTIGMPAKAAWFAFLYPIKGLAPSKALRKEPAAFSFLLGGFLYFDESQSFIRFNALALSPSPVSLKLTGPCDGAGAFGEALTARGRLADVTISELRAGGFLQFAWVHPAEELDGKALGSDACMPRQR